MLSSAFAKEQKDAKHLKVLMIGNSFSICVLKQMPQCAADAGVVLDLASLFIGGCPLEKRVVGTVGHMVERMARPQSREWVVEA